MAKRWRPSRKIPNDDWRRCHGRAAGAAPLTMAAIGWSHLREMFRRGRPAERIELPRAARRRRKIQAPVAIYHFTAKVIKRSHGRSAVAAAAYRAGGEFGR